jgi:transposase
LEILRNDAGLRDYETLSSKHLEASESHSEGPLAPVGWNWRGFHQYLVPGHGTSEAGPIIARAYSMDSRLRVLRDAVAGLSTAELAEWYHVSVPWVNRLKQRQRETGNPSPRRQMRWRTPILHGQTTQLEALIQEQHDRTLAELKDLLATPASLPTVCRAVRILGYRINQNGTRGRAESR